VSHVSSVGKEADHLNFHAFKEGDGVKGGINVASMMMKSLKQLGLLQVNGEGNPVPGNELNIVMDNCGGQNKNNHVSLLAPCLIEMGYFMRVNMLFLWSATLRMFVTAALTI
jgi:hypothetical protein